MRVIWVLVGLCLSLPAIAEPLRLGAVSLTDATDRDLVELPACDGSRNRPVTSLQLRVAEYPAQIDRLVVEFGNGERQELQLKKHFSVGASSRWMDLQGPARCIRRIGVVGDTDTPRRAPNRQARISFMGDSVGGGGASPGDAKPPAGGGAADGVLGTMTLSDQPDRDVLRLAPCGTRGNTPVNQIKMRVDAHPAEINRVRVIFENGNEVNVPVNRVIKPGTTSDWRDLPGDKRCIDRIVVVGDTESVGFQPGKQARVTFFGR